MVVFVILPTVPFISRKSLEERPKRSKSKKSRSLLLLCYRFMAIIVASNLTKKMYESA